MPYLYTSFSAKEPYNWWLLATRVMHRMPYVAGLFPRKSHESRRLSVAIMGWLQLVALLRKETCSVAIMGWLQLVALLRKETCTVAIIGWLQLVALLRKETCNDAD